MAFGDWTALGLWFAVLGSGLYHGINPGMGWPLAVSAGMMGRGQRDVIAALWPLAIGHLVAMAGILLPFAIMASMVEWQRAIRIAAGLIVVGMGLYLLINRHHPRFMARIPPTQLALWSFAVAMAHGAGLMLVPIYLGLCRADEMDAGHSAAISLMGGNIQMAVAVSVAHTGAMIASGGVFALAVFRWLGPQFISKSWFNLDVMWALSLIFVGGLGLAGVLML